MLQTPLLYLLYSLIVILFRNYLLVCLYRGLCRELQGRKDCEYLSSCLGNVCSRCRILQISSVALVNIVKIHESSNCIFFDLTQETLKELQIFINDTEHDKCQDSVALDSRDDYKSKDAAESETSEDPPNKRAKLETSITDVQSEEEAAAVVKSKDGDSHVCVVCLGILQGLCGTTQAIKVCALDSIHCFRLHCRQC